MSDKPLFLLRNSPLTEGGHARVMSPKRRRPGRAKARGISGPEVIGYTEEPRKALTDAGECPSPAWVDAKTDLAAQRAQVMWLAEVQHAQATRPQLSILHRLAEVKRRARAKHVNVWEEYNAVLRMLNAAKTENDRRRARTELAALVRLGRIEERLDGFYPANVG
jgi:hypothetical protein